MCGLLSSGPQDCYSDCNSDETYTVGSNVTVAVRVRPLTSQELNRKDVRNCLHVTNNVVTVNNSLEFIFDHCIQANEDNAYLYRQIGEPLLEHALEGRNVCMFAYGQTGSGKTHSIMGRDGDPGIMLRFIRDLFERVEFTRKRDSSRVTIKCSYYEIYNEKIHDLLGNDSKTPLRVRQCPTAGPHIVDLSTFECSCFHDVLPLIKRAQERRSTAGTSMNQKSSRSHAIFTLVITQNQDLDDDYGQNISSKVNIVDLAGSERTRALNTSGYEQSPISKGKGVNYDIDQKFKQSVLINKSLLTLGKVITALAEYDYDKGTSISYIPYRESVLTWLLKESLGGNSKTTMIATISPASIHHEETLNTLRYAATARRVVNIVKINEDPKIRRIRELEHEVEVLRQRISLMESSTPINRGRSSCCSHVKSNSVDNRRRSNISNSSPIRVYKTTDLLKHVKELFADILKEDMPILETRPKTKI